MERKIKIFTGRNTVSHYGVVAEIKELDTGRLEFTAHGYHFDAKRRDWSMGGQCLDKPEFSGLAMHYPEVAKVIGWWKKYHLNTMHAGTVEQEAAIKEAKASGKLASDCEYTECCNYLESVGLYEVQHDGQPYKYGHGWITFDIPEDVEAEMREFCALPDEEIRIR